MKLRTLAVGFLPAVVTFVHAQPCQTYWSGVGSGTCYSTNVAFNLKAFDDGSGMALYAVTCNQVRRWDGLAWMNVSHGVSGTPVGLLELDEGTGPSLFLYGRLGNDAYLLQWNGSEWQSSTPGLFQWQSVSEHIFPHVSVPEIAGPTIYGVHYVSFTSSVTRWNGTAWETIGPTTNSNLRLIGFDDGSGIRLHVAGGTAIGGIPTGGLAKWDGEQWNPLLISGVDTIGFVRDLTAGEIAGSPALYLMANRSIHGVLQPESVRRWDGQTLTDIGLPNWYREPNQMFSYSSLHIFDDGSGPGLYLGGGFAYDTRELPPRGNIGRWDGTEWHRLGVGLRGRVDTIDSMTVNGTPTLFAAGLVWQIGEGLVPGIAQWVGCPNCYANCDQSTRAPALNIDDFTCYINRFAALDPYADCTVDGSLNIDDFLCFINHFAAASSGGLNCP